MKTLCLAGLVVALTTTAAFADVCDELSYERNRIYKRAGYCFKTRAQIERFGNEGCQFEDMNDVPLSATNRADIATFVREERRNGCN